MPRDKRTGRPGWSGTSRRHHFTKLTVRRVLKYSVASPTSNGRATKWGPYLDSGIFVENEFSFRSAVIMIKLHLQNNNKFSK
jgi:hypothetical protein